jgi:transposase-like protein
MTDSIFGHTYAKKDNIITIRVDESYVKCNRCMSTGHEMKEIKKSKNECQRYLKSVVNIF